MTIGFLGASLQVISLMKSALKLYPQAGCVVYIDTKERLATPASTERAFLWLCERGADVVVLEEGLTVSDEQLTVCTLGEVESYLQNVSESTSIPLRRDIFLTEHSAEQDAQLAELLGGFFIAK